MRLPAILVCLILPLQVMLARGTESSSAVISGELLFQSTTPVVMHFETWTKTIFGQKVTNYAVPVEHAKFKLVINLTGMTVLTFSVNDVKYIGNFSGESSLLIEEGDSLHMQINGVKGIMSELEFTGKGSEKACLKRAIGNVYGQSRDKKITLESSTGQLKQDKLKIFALIEDYKDHLSTSAYLKMQADCLSSILSSFAYYLFDNPFRENQDVLAAVYRKTKKVLHADHMREFGQMAMEYPEVFELYAVMDFIVDNGIDISWKAASNRIKKYDAMESYLSNDPLRICVLANYINRFARVEGWTNSVDSLFTRFSSIVPPESIYLAELVKLRSNFTLEKEKNFISQFVLRDTLNNNVTLGRFEGKVILIDFMYTGCGACATTTPVLIDIENYFKGEDIVFVSISIDVTLSKFKKGIGKFSSPYSFPLYTGGSGFEHDIIKRLNIIGYPTLVLIGKDGSVISSRLPDPRKEVGDKELRRSIRNALLQD